MSQLGKDEISKKKEKFKKVMRCISQKGEGKRQGEILGKRLVDKEQKSKDKKKMEREGKMQEIQEGVREGNRQGDTLEEMLVDASPRCEEKFLMTGFTLSFPLGGCHFKKTNKEVYLAKME